MQCETGVFLPRLCSEWRPPEIIGAAALTTEAMGGTGLDVLSRWIDAADVDPAARLYDGSILRQLALRRLEGLAMQASALSAAQVFRVRRPAVGRATVRVLALAAPGDLMINTPLDFITNHLNVQLDVLFVLPDCPLPEVIPEHDVLFVAISEADATLRARLQELCAVWPRPVVNEPSALPSLARDVLSQRLADVAGVLSPMTIRVGGEDIDAVPLPAEGFPLLFRPIGSHAGQGLLKLDDMAGLRAAVSGLGGGDFFLTQYVDYRSVDGLFRKYRVGFIAGAPFLCHMAVSEHWMVHYLNAGMTECAAKRADEAQAMAAFDSGFAVRHRAAFAALHAVLPFDVYSIDCAEVPDGRLVLFEADTAAIIHAMDPVDLFPYKHEQMRRFFAEFGSFLRSKAGLVGLCDYGAEAR